MAADGGMLKASRADQDQYAILSIARVGPKWATRPMLMIMGKNQDIPSLALGADNFSEPWVVWNIPDAIVLAQCRLNGKAGMLEETCAHSESDRDCKVETLLVQMEAYRKRAETAALPCLG